VTGSWHRYYEAAGEAPRETLLDALGRFEQEGGGPGLAVDLGCGTGRDTAELLRRGWRVVAIDAEKEAIERLRALLDSDERLTPVVSSIESARWPRARLVNASFALPFVPPAAFPEVWRRIRRSLEPGGRFSGQLFGDRDDWAGGRGLACHKGEITFHTPAEVDDLVRPFSIERLDEVEEDGETAIGEAKHWHLFNVVVRKP
jgi:tellurite methyltransferase